ncbi:MAG TPA: phage tail sheath C-terminal domain-containing protein [Nitriliruptorales bacterium]|nr:phage tail sheath C-terminal domain-containing protein [Nitriliruptorales bacterium]
MSETILPGVLIEVRPEGLIVPGGVTVGTLGVVGTAAKGPGGSAELLGSYTEAVATFGIYDRWVDGSSGELTLVRALEQAYRHGASSVYAVRVSDGNDAQASVVLGAPGGDCVRIDALTPGTWGNGLTVEVTTADANAVVRDEEVDSLTLGHTPVVPSAVNRIVVRPAGGGADLVPGIVYDTAPNPSQVSINTGSGALNFGTAPGGADTVLATYTVARSSARKVTIRSPQAEEAYSIVSGDDLVADLAAISALAAGVPLAAAGELPDEVAETPLTGGANGAAGADYQAGLDVLLTVPAHIIVAAGQDHSFGDDLAAHCALASGDEIKRERIAVVGTALGEDLSDIQAHTLDSDRVVLVAPGIVAADRSQSPPTPVTLPGAYAAAAIAGKLSSLSAHISPTNKTLPVDDLETTFTRAELKQLVLGRVLVLEERQGFRITKGITTSTNTAWHQITTRRIVDYAKFGVRSAATPYIGLLNNERVRAAMRATINSFLATMVDDEMLVSYELDVSATRAEEIRGIARVELVLRPTFSIDFIKVTMFLE